MANFFAAVDLKLSSKDTYKRQLQPFVLWLKNNSIDTPDKQVIIAYIDYLQNIKHLSANSICSYITAIKRFFAWLKSTNICDDITKKIRRPKILPLPNKKSLSGAQIAVILKTIDSKTVGGKRDFALINLMMSTGLRTTQIAPLLLGDIANCCGSQLLWIQTGNDKGKIKNIKLSKNIFNPIKDYLEARQAHSASEPLFASHSKKNFGQPLTIRSVSRIIKNRLIAAKLDISRLSVNSLRYTASRLNLSKQATSD